MKTSTIKEKNLCNKDFRERTGKNNVTYGVVKEIYNLNGCEREAYGIAAYLDAETDGTATVILSVNDITPDYNALSDLVEKLNRNNASLIHIFDIVEDFLS